MNRSQFSLAVFMLYSILGTAKFVKSGTPPDSSWHKELSGGINVSQTSFDNWTQGGENSLAWQINLNGKEVLDKDQLNWSNSFKFSFGKTKVSDHSARKSIDEIRLESVFQLKLDIFATPYIAATGETQAATGYAYSDNTATPVSSFFDPVYFTQSIGTGYSPVETIMSRIGLALKETITRNYPRPYADDPTTAKTEKNKVEPGAESVTDFSKKLNETTLFTSKLELFSNMKSFREIDVKWDNLLIAKISNYFNVNLNVKLFYDRDISKKRQLKQALALGITYIFL